VSQWQRQAALAAAQKGLTSATMRYSAMQSALSFLGPVMWAWLAVDLVRAAVGTDYARVVRAVYILAQVGGVDGVVLLRCIFYDVFALWTALCVRVCRSVTTWHTSSAGGRALTRCFSGSQQSMCIKQQQQGLWGPYILAQTDLLTSTNCEYSAALTGGCLLLLITGASCGHARLVKA
jgi:hypothetical protein